MMANYMMHTCITKASRVNNLTASCLRYKSTVAQSVTVDENGSTNYDTVDTTTTQFAKAKIGTFFQSQPHLGNQFLEDVTLQKYLQRHIPDDILGEINKDLEQFGERVSSSISILGRECEDNPPFLQNYEAWGKRTDTIVTSHAWKQLKSISAEEGLIAIAYERKYHEWSRLYQMAKLFLFSPSSGIYTCPLAMTDGAAKSIEAIGKDGLLSKAYKRLTSRDPKLFWTSGQWMTERKGGSDVAAGTQTVALKQSDNSYKLHGYKWFSSATDSDMALTLARVCDRRGQFVEGTRGLSMFYLEVRNSDGSMNNIEVQRLKDKLGTRAVPTAELLLDGTKAFRVSNEGHGVASIANMLTLTRIHNALSSAAAMRRVVSLARDYSTKRECFGRTIDKHALHIKTIANMEVEARAATLLTLELSRLLGLDDCHKITATDKDMLRLLTPIAKLYTAKQAVAVVSEGLECFGGMGYMEDSGLPVLLRDAQVLPIWEGTTNILSLDVLRAIYKSQGSVLKSFTDQVLGRLAVVKSTGSKDLHGSIEKIESSLQQTLEFAKKNMHKLDIAARDFSYSLARVYMGLLLLEHASWNGAANDDIFAANRWCRQDLSLVSTQSRNANYDQNTSDLESQLVFAGYSATSRL